MDIIMIIMLIVGVIGLTITEFRAYEMEKKYRKEEQENERINEK